MSVTAENTNTLTVRPVAGHIGADISGVDLSRPLQPEEIARIRAALLHWKVVFFRGQQLDHPSQIAFARGFGELTYAHPHDATPPEGYPEIFTIDPERFERRYTDGLRQQHNRRKYSYFGGWHTDVTPAVNPPAASILRAETVPEHGGDTTWTNTVAAYEGLSAPVRAFVDGLRANTVTAPTRRPWARAAMPAGSTTTCWSPITPWCAYTRRRASGRCSSPRASPATSST